MVDLVHDDELGLPTLDLTLCLHEVADSPLFPFTYNALVKAVQGSSGLTLAMYAATRLVLEELAGPATGSRSRETWR